MTVRRLDRDEFANALKAGRGSALMHVEAYGLDGVDDLVLAACIENQVYDPQCESRRAPWLYRMFSGSMHRERFERAICDAIPKENDYHNADQLCDLLSLIALDGYDKAAEALRDYVYGNQISVDSPNRFVGFSTLIRLDGQDAVIELARAMGLFLLKDPNAHVVELEYLIEDGLRYDEVESVISRLAEQGEATAAYLYRHRKLLEKQKSMEAKSPEERQSARRDHIQRERSVAKLFEAANTGDGFSRPYWSMAGSWSTSEDRESVLARIINEPRSEVCARLLSYFGRSELPYLHPRLWELAQESDSLVRDATLKALAGFDDESIGEFARKLIMKDEFAVEDAEVLRLFTRNFRTGDEILLLQVLEKLDGDDPHYVALSILDICKQNRTQAMASLAEWVYRVTPCTVCRESAIDLLSDILCLSVEMANECLYDANPDTRMIARTYLKKDIERSGIA